MRKVRLISSLGAKLFLLTAGLVLVTVGVNSWQSARLFKKDLERFSQDETIQQAGEAAQIAAAIVDNWMLEIGMLVHSLPGLSDAAREQQIVHFLSASPELVAFQLARRDAAKFKSLTYAFTQQKTSARFDGQDTSLVAASLKKATLTLLNGARPESAKKSPVIRNLAPTLKLPLLAIALPFSFAGGEEIWAVLVVWQNRLGGLLPSGKLVSSILVDGKGEVLSASDKTALVSGDPLMTGALLPLVNQGNPGSGFATFQGPDGSPWLGAFAKVPSLPQWVMVRRDAKSLEEAGQALIKRTVVWAWMFILVAVLASVLGASSLTRHIRALTLATRRIAGGDFETKVAAAGRDEVGVLATSISDMASQIKKLLVSQVAQARLEQEIATAKMVQESFFPKGANESLVLDLAWQSKSASECGGDWWGHFPLGKGLELICIADATGHGAPAALVTAIAYSTTCEVASVAREDTALGGAPFIPSTLLVKLNKALNKALDGRLGMTFFAAVIDNSSGAMHYANAGHNFPLLMPAKIGEVAASRKVTSLNKANGTPLGFDPLSSYKDAVMTLNPGDKLVFFTDGLLECCSPDNRQWGKTLFLKTLKAHEGAHATDLLNATLTAAFDHFRNMPLADDVTLVVAEVSKAWTT